MGVNGGDDFVLCAVEVFLYSSHLQARSLGSVALRKAESMEGGLHFNVFTVDFNEELVALYGGSLLRQTHFLHESIKAILRLYKVGMRLFIFEQSERRLLPPNAKVCPC